MATETQSQLEATSEDELTTRVLRLGLPKGSLQQSTFELLDRAGYSFSVSERSYFPSTDDEEVTAMLARAQEIARYVMDGVFDARITAKDWVRDNDADAETVADPIYSTASMWPVRWVLAGPESSDINSVQALAGKRIATPVVNIPSHWLDRYGVEADVEFSC